MNVEVNFAFPAAYEANLLLELPVNIPRFYFPGANPEGGKDGLIIKIAPQDGNEWIGVFAFGYPSPSVKSGLYSCPSEQVLCVVSQGYGCMVRVDEPSSWEQVLSYPITDVRPIKQHNLIVFADFTRLTAYGRTGRLWQTNELSWDGIEISAVSDDSIHGYAWDAPNEKKVAFTVDLNTGHQVGGSSPTDSK